MTEQRQKVEHPEWCDRTRCTAPELVPTFEEYKAADCQGEHRSAGVSLTGARGVLFISLSQIVCPWDTSTYLCLQAGEYYWNTELGDQGDYSKGFELYELLGQGIAPSVRQWPTLYAERFPHLAEQKEQAR